MDHPYLVDEYKWILWEIQNNYLDHDEEEDLLLRADCIWWKLSEYDKIGLKHLSEVIKCH